MELLHEIGDRKPLKSIEILTLTGRSVRLHFRDRPWDLFGALAYTFTVAAVLLLFQARSLVWILAILFIPGYLSVSALFPRKTDMSWFERLGLSICVSMAVVALLGLILNFTPWGIRLSSIISAISSFAFVATVLAYQRRLQVGKDKRVELDLSLRVPSFQNFGMVEKGLAILLAVAIAITSGLTGWFLLVPPPREKFTEFDILGPNGQLSQYPRNLNVSETGNVVMGVANYEGITTNYTLRIELVGLRFRYNATIGSNETVDINSTTLSWFNFTLENGQSWSNPFAFSIPYSGPWRIQFLLFKQIDLAIIYRQLHLIVIVS